MRWRQLRFQHPLRYEHALRDQRPQRMGEVPHLPLPGPLRLPPFYPEHPLPADEEDEEWEEEKTANREAEEVTDPFAFLDDGDPSEIITVVFHVLSDDESEGESSTTSGSTRRTLSSSSSKPWLP